MKRPVMHSVVALAAAAMLIPAAAVPSATTENAQPKLPKPKVYDVTVTGTHTTTFINKGCDPYCGEQYEGSHSWTQTFRNVRTAYSVWGVGLSLNPGKAFNGVSVERFDHGSDSCTHETPAGKRQASLRLFALFTQPGQLGQWSLDLDGESVGQWQGAPVGCQSRAERISLKGRVGGTLVSGSSRDGSTSLDFRGGTTKAGSSFPLKQLIAGNGFAVSLKGKSVINQQDLGIKKYAYSTTGSVRVVFTPRGRSAAGGQPSP